jgi:hypothetical protein
MGTTCSDLNESFSWAKNSYRRVQLAEHVHEFFVRRERDVARTGCGFRDGSAGRGQSSLGRVEFVNQHLVQAEVGNVDKMVVFGFADPVGVRPFLVLVRAVFALVGNGSGMLAEFAVGENRVDDGVAGGVVGGEKKLAGAVEIEMAGPFALRGLRVQERELAAFGIDGERADGAAVIHFVGGVEVFAAGMDDDPRGVLGFGGEFERGHFPGGGIERELVNAFAFGFRRVVSDVGAVGFRGGRFRSFSSSQCRQHQQKDSNGKSQT